MQADIPEVKAGEEHEFRLTNLCVGSTELEQTLTQLEEKHIPHRVDEYEAVDTTHWPKQPDGKNTVYAVYSQKPRKEQNRLITGEYGGE